MAKSVKNDRKDGKLRWELLPLDLVEYLVRVYTFGAEKYAPNSWQNLEDGYQRYKAALMRHMVAYEKGEFADPESGLPHLAHMAWNALAMLYFGIRGTLSDEGTVQADGAEDAIASAPTERDRIEETENETNAPGTMDKKDEPINIVKKWKEKMWTWTFC